MKEEAPINPIPLIGLKPLEGIKGPKDYLNLTLVKIGLVLKVPT